MTEQERDETAGVEAELQTPDEAISTLEALVARDRPAPADRWQLARAPCMGLRPPLRGR